jgi:hypothetical protein
MAKGSLSPWSSTGGWIGTTSRPTSGTSRGGARVWRALARAVPSRLGLGGVISPRRDLALILALGRMVRSWARRLAIRVCGDGRASDITA